MILGNRKDVISIATRTEYIIRNLLMKRLGFQFKKTAK